MAKKKDFTPLVIIGLLGLAAYAILSSNENNDDTDNLSVPYGGNDPKSGLPRGIANNNPLNLSLSNISWQGKVPNASNTDFGKPRMEQFTELWNGIRANLLNINSQMKANPNMKFHEFISLWGTGNKNNYNKNAAVTNYANYVVGQMQKYGFPNMTVAYPMNPFNKYSLAELRPAMWALFRGMAEFENGKQYAPMIAQMKPDFDKAFDSISTKLLQG